jgi:hypothetical protein
MVVVHSISCFQENVVSITFHWWLAWKINNRNNNIVTSFVKLEHMQTEWCKTILYWQLQNIVHWFATLQLSLPTIPTAQPLLSFGWHVETSLKLMVITGTVKLLLLYVPKNYIICNEFFFWQNHSTNTMGRDQEFWMTGAWKQRFKEQYDNVFLILSVFWDQKKYSIPAWKWLIRE